MWKLHASTSRLMRCGSIPLRQGACFNDGERSSSNCQRNIGMADPIDLLRRGLQISGSTEVLTPFLRHLSRAAASTTASVEQATTNLLHKIQATAAAVDAQLAVETNAATLVILRQDRAYLHAMQVQLDAMRSDLAATSASLSRGHGRDRPG